MKWIIAYMCVLGLMILLNSCAKKDDVSPGNNKSPITNQTSAQETLNGIYYAFANVGTGPLQNVVVNWYRVHEIPAAFRAGIIKSINAQSADSADVATNPTVAEMWINFYGIINYANFFIKEVSGAPEDKFTTKSKNEMLGEARFLRAYANYQLLTYFGEFYDVKSLYGVMLRKETLNADNIALKRSSVADTYAYILDDIDFAIANAPLNNAKQYANKWVAKALKVRLLINRGAGDDYLQAVNLTEDIINNGPYELEPNLKDLFYTQGINSKEVMLGIVPQLKQTDKLRVYQNNFIATDYLVALFANDPRSTWMIQPSDNFNGYFDIAKYAGGSQKECGYAFRLTEMYLLQAEAIVRSNGNLLQAKARLKTVMSHAGITDFSLVDNATPDMLKLLIYQEIVKNLFCEDGAEWFSLLRVSFDQIKATQSSINYKYQYIFPIPADEIRNNKNIVQNPGY